MASSTSRRFCMAIWLVLSSAVLALVGVFIGTLGALMNLSGTNETALLIQNSNITQAIASNSRLYGLYGDQLYKVLSPIDRNLNNQTDQIDFTIIFGRWSLDIVFMILGWLLVACAIVAILLPIVRCRPSKSGDRCSNSAWLLSLGVCVTIFSVYDVALVVLVIVYYAFRDAANLAAIDYINGFAFAQRYAGDIASDYRTSSPEIFSFTLLINFVQRTYSCCGFTSYRDFSGGAARLWSQTTAASVAVAVQQSPPAVLPLVCCADIHPVAVNVASSLPPPVVTLDACRSDITTGNYRAVNWNTIGCYQTLISDLGQRVSIGATAAISMLVVVLSTAVVAGSLLIDMERQRKGSYSSSGATSSSSSAHPQHRRHHRHGGRHQRRHYSNDNEWQLHQSSSVYSDDDDNADDDEEFTFPNKLYAQGNRF